MAPTETEPVRRRRTGVVGSPVAHSLSPVLHEAAFRVLDLTGWTYERVEADERGLPALVASLDESWVGLSVTMPGKRAALEVATTATDRALAVGAANTLVRNDSGGWRADCTDVEGVVGALRVADRYVPSDDATGLVLGAGGTACAAIAGLGELGVRSIDVVVREPLRAAAAVRCAEKLGITVEVRRWDEVDFGALAEAASVVVNTAPASAIERHVTELASAPCVLDVIYHPWPTVLAEEVTYRGGRLATGLDMLLHQAFGQFEQFTGRPAPQEAMRDALREVTGGIVPLPLD